MATLTEAAYYSRKAVNWGIAALIGFVILRISFNWAVAAIKQAFPPPPLVPNNLFGKLPQVVFPSTASPSGQLTFTLQTISGTVPDASDAAKVFFMPKNRINLLSLSKAQSFVSRLGFTGSPRQLTETAYRWIDLKSPLRSIEMDIVSNQFRLSYSFTHDLTLFAERNIPTQQQAINESLVFLQTLALSTADITSTNTNISYLKLIADKLEPTTSQSQADAVRIDFFRTGYVGLPVVYDKPNQSNISFVLSGSKRSDRRILSVEYNYWPVETRSTAIYKLKTSQQAWNQLTQGDAYFASYKTDQTKIVITNVYLAYYDSKQEQLYMQPVFVFEGENNFVAYVPAIALPWVEQK